MLIIGSRAIKHHISSFREPRDWDVICTPDEFQLFRQLNSSLLKYLTCKHSKKWIFRRKDLQIEFEIGISGSSGELLLQKLDSNNYNLNLDVCRETDFPVKFGNVIYYANLEICLLLKKSHIGYQIHWKKNIEDYSYLKTNVPNLEFFSMIFEDFMEKRALEMKDRFSNRKKIDMDKDNADFFKSSQKSLKRKYKHDLLHEYTCFYNKPIYLRLKKDKSKAAVDESLWNLLSHKDKIRAVQEESMVIALERKIIPAKDSKETWDLIECFRWALMRISTNLTDGFFQQFALDNYTEIMSNVPLFDKMFFSKVDLAV